MKKIIQLVALFGLCVTAASATAEEKATADLVRVMISTNMGDITLQLDNKRAPVSVANFIAYANSGAYNGTVFHRVIPGFMIQGGGFDEKLARRDTQAAIKNEADNGLLNRRGTIAMARTNAPHSATSQFFINLKDNGFLNHRSPTPRGWGYAVFGQVIDGMDVVDKIAAQPTGAGGPFRQDVPKQAMVIKQISVIPAQ